MPTIAGPGEEAEKGVQAQPQDVKPEFALGRLLLREVYLAAGQDRSDAQRELRKIVDSRMYGRGSTWVMIHAGLDGAEVRQYLARYLENLQAAKKMQETITSSSNTAG